MMRNLLEDGARRQPERLVWSDAEGDFSYAALAGEARAVAARLEEVRHGDRVALIAANSRFHLSLAFACWQRGACLVPVNTRLSPRERDALLADCQPRLVLSDAQTDSPASALGLADFWLRAERPFRPVAGDAEDCALILYTSGTTGRAKGAMLSFRMLAANIRNTVQGWELGPGDRTLLFAPLFHTGGWNVLTLPLLAVGGHTRLLAGFDAEAVVSAFDRVSVLFGVPTMFRRMLETGRLAHAPRRRLRFVISGGAPCPEPLARAYLELGIEFRQGYGLTEAGPNCFVLPGSCVRSKLGSVGRPMPAIGLRLEAGELVMQGDHLFSGYWRQPQRSAEVLRKGELYTGDLAQCDEEGFVTIVGRRKDMFISGGENVYPAEIEVLLEELPELAEVAVVGVPDRRWGEVGCACVVPSPGAGFDPESLRAHLAGKLARYKLPARWQRLEALPRNSLGKVQKTRLRELLAV